MLRDHLGNTRVTFTDANNDGVVGESDIKVINNYYPFGMDMEGNWNGSFDNTNNKYKYNGKEWNNDFGLGWYDYGARWYTPDAPRWVSVDPLSEKMRRHSPYNYAFDNPVRFVDPDGAYPWPVNVRSFISTPTTGGGLFYGDGRGASFKGTSRVYSSFTVDPSAKIVTQPVTKSDPTIFFGVPGQIPPKVDQGKPKGANDNISFSGNTTSLDFSHSGKDPITPQAATPALDVHAVLLFNEDKKNGILNIAGAFFGDKFPSTEAFITDQSGESKVFLGAKKEDGSIADLFGDNKEKLFSVDIQVKFNENGNFIGVQQGNKKYSVEDWNKKVQEGFEK